MRTYCKVEGTQVSFGISDLETLYHGTAQHLYYRQTVDGFVKTYPADTPHLERIYHNFERYAEEMILQIARVQPVPWERALQAFLKIVKLNRVDWWLTGSAALAVRGLDVAPGDIDLITDDYGAQCLGEILLDYFVEPMLPVKGWICRWFGSAFLHARVDVAGGVHQNVDKPRVTDYGPTAASRLETVDWQGEKIRVPPLDLQLLVSKRRGLEERAEKIERFMKLKL